MPGFDRTGPGGIGSMTGGGRGRCVAADARPARGLGRRYAMGGGRGFGAGSGRGLRQCRRFFDSFQFRRGFGGVRQEVDDLVDLKDQARLLESELEGLRDHITRIETQGE